MLISLSFSYVLYFSVSFGVIDKVLDGFIVNRLSTIGLTAVVHVTVVTVVDVFCVFMIVGHVVWVGCVMGRAV